MFIPSSSFCWFCVFKVKILTLKVGFLNIQFLDNISLFLFVCWFMICFLFYWLALQSWLGACMCTKWRKGSKMKLRESFCSQPMDHIWKWQLIQLSDCLSFGFLKCMKGLWTVCGFAFLHFMPIVHLILHAFLLYSQFPGTPFFAKFYSLSHFFRCPFAGLIELI